MLLLLLLGSVDLLLDVDVGPIVMSGGHQEVAGLLALLWPDVAVGGELVITSWELVLWILVHIQFLVLLCCFQLVALKKHFDLEAKIVLVAVCSDP